MMGKKKKSGIVSIADLSHAHGEDDRPKEVMTAFGNSIELSDKFTFQTKHGRKCTMRRITGDSWECRSADDDTGGRVWFAEQIIDRLITKEWMDYYDQSN